MVLKEQSESKKQYQSLCSC